MDSLTIGDVLTGMLGGACVGLIFEFIKRVFR